MPRPLTRPTLPRPLAHHPRRRALVALAVAGVTVGALAVPAGAALAAHPAPKASAHGHDAPPPGPKAPPLGEPDGRELGWWPYGNVLHGSFTVDTRERGVVDMVVQRGTVTAVSAGELTVTSKDGVAVTWETSSTTRTVGVPPGRGRGHGARAVTVAVGAQVGVWGTGGEDGPVATVVLVRGAGERPAPSPSPSPSPSSSPSVSPDPSPSPSSTSSTSST